MSTEISNLNPEAFGEIVRRYQNLVSATTFSITGNLQQSEDLAQETFIAAWQNLDSLREPEKLAGWLCGIARNLSRKWIRKVENRQSFSPETPVEQLAAPPLEEENDREEQAALLWNTIKHIPEMYREPLVMYYRQNQTVGDIASALDISEANVRQRIARGRSFLKEEIERKVETALERLRPSEHFVVAVLAAIPVLAVQSQCVAASSAASSAMTAGKASAVPSLGLYLWSLVTGILSPFLLLTGFVCGMNSAVRNAPTLRSRRFMLKVVACHFTAFFTWLALCFVAEFSAAMVSKYILGKEQFPLSNSWYLAGMLLIPVYCCIASFRFNSRWRTIVEEDQRTEKSQFIELESSTLSLRSIKKTFWISLLSAGIALAILFVAAVLPAIVNARHYPPGAATEIITFGIAFLLLLVMYYALFFRLLRFAENEAAFQKYPPRLSNLLSLLTGESPVVRGFRNRITFWSDLVFIGLGSIWIQHMVLLISRPYLKFESPWITVFQWGSALGLVLFVILFAGMPRRRYWGIVLYSLVLVILDVPLMIRSEYWVKDYPLIGFEFQPVGKALLLLFIFAVGSIGLAGLYVFRKKTATS